MTKEQKIIRLLLENVEELQWLEGEDETFYTNLGTSRVKIDRYNCDIYVDNEYIGTSSPLEDKIVKIRREIRAKQRDKTLDTILNTLNGILQ